jgi:hypothetical protein
MSASETPLPDAPNAAPATPGDDLIRTTLKRQLHMLADLAKAGVVIAEAVGQGALEARAERAPVSDVCDLVRAFDRVNRAVRYTIMLEGRLLGELIALDSGEARPPARSPGPAHAEAQAEAQAEDEARKAQVAEALSGIIANDQKDGQDTERRERLERETAERLRDDSRLADILTLPISEVIDIICRDLGIQPDWLRLSEEDWARGELRSGKVGAALATAVLSGAPPDDPQSDPSSEAGERRTPLSRPSWRPPIRAAEAPRRRRA